jgi:hypothetical protein
MSVVIIPLGEAWPWPLVSDAYRAGSSDWFETTEERADDALGAVPPIYFRGGFFMGEPAAHDDRGKTVYAAFVKIGARYFCREVAVDLIAPALDELRAAALLVANVEATVSPYTPAKAPDRNETIKIIRAALRQRSGKTWSVTGGTGTAWGWISIDAPPARRTWEHHEGGAWSDTGRPGGSTGPAECSELAALLGLDQIQHQGVSIPSSSKHYVEYIDRAEGRPPSVRGEQYWD